MYDIFDKQLLLFNFPGFLVYCQVPLAKPSFDELCNHFEEFITKEYGKDTAKEMWDLVEFDHFLGLTQNYSLGSDALVEFFRAVEMQIDSGAWQRNFKIMLDKESKQVRLY